MLLIDVNGRLVFPSARTRVHACMSRFAPAWELEAPSVAVQTAARLCRCGLSRDYEVNYSLTHLLSPVESRCTLLEKSR